MKNMPDKIAKVDTTSSVTEEVFAQGQLLGGKYRVISELGTGGMGTVYRVQQVFLHKEFALKTIQGRVVSDVLLQRFQLEAQAASSLSHPNLVHVYDFGVLDDGQPYLVMDLVDGITLAEYLKEQGPMPVDLVAPVFAQACFGLLAAHDQGVVHRDIKPGNIMVVTDVPADTEGCVKVLDFGIAKLTSNDAGEIQALTRTGEIFGSPLYMSPEQCIGGVVDHRSDIYSLGCVLFEMLTGTPPFVGANALSTMMLHESGNTPTLKEGSLGKDFPDALQEIVDRMLRKAPSERYQNIGMVAHDLAAVCHGRHLIADSRPSKTIPEKPAKIVSMSAGRFYLVLIMTASVTSISGSLGGYFFRQGQMQQGLAVASTPGKQSLSSATAQQVGRFLQNPEPGKYEPHVFLFPEDKSVGTLYLVENGRPQDPLPGSQRSARGRVAVPFGAKLLLEAHETLSNQPNLFRRFGADDLTTLFLDPESSWRDEHINCINHLNGLTVLTMNEAAVTAKCIADLNKLTRLERLYLNGPALTDADKAKIERLPKLVAFSAKNTAPSLSATLRKMKNSQNICVLDAQMCELGDDDMSVIATMPNLKNLYINGNKQISNRGLSLISNLKSLSTLEILGTSVTPASIPALKNMKSLTHLRIDSAHWSDADKKQLVRDGPPGLEIELKPMSVDDVIRG